MSTRNAAIRVFLGLIIIGALYGAPYLVGIATAGSRLSPCLRDTKSASDIVVKLGFIPGPTEIEELQRYGRYGGSGGNIQNIVLLGVPERNRELLSRLYWLEEIATVGPCHKTT